MIFKEKLGNIETFFKILIIFFIFFNILLFSKSFANTFKINEIEVSEDFNLDFNKEKVFDKAFQRAFYQLISTIASSKDINKIEKTNLSTVKSLIDSFNVSDEKFIENKYFAKFNVNFNKKNIFKYFENQNIFPSIPKKINLLLFPILIDEKKNEITYLRDNPVYIDWQKNEKKHHLLNYILPTEDIEEREIFNNNADAIEEFNFDQVAKKYDLNDYIIVIIYQNIAEINVYSKLKLNNSYKVFNKNYKDIDLKNESSISKLIFDLKGIYEDEWKKLNIINTSIQLPLTVFLASKDFRKIRLFENTLEDLDLVSEFAVVSFNNENIFYKIVYNGSPNKFFEEVELKGLNIEKNNQIWEIQ